MEYKKFRTPSLIDKCVQGDALAWAEFVIRFSSLIEFSIKKTLLQYSAHPGSACEEIKDIRQNIMISLWSKNKLNEVKQKENIDYWLVIIARNAAIDYLRKQKKEMVPEDKTYFERLPAQKNVSREMLENAEGLDKKMKRTYKFLAPREKLIFKFYFKKNLKTKEIAKILNISIGNITSTISKIRKKILRKI